MLSRPADSGSPAIESCPLISRERELQSAKGMAELAVEIEVTTTAPKFQAGNPEAVDHHVGNGEVHAERRRERPAFGMGRQRWQPDAQCVRRFGGQSGRCLNERVVRRKPTLDFDVDPGLSKPCYERLRREPQPGDAKFWPFPCLLDERSGELSADRLQKLVVGHHR